MLTKKELNKLRGKMWPKQPGTESSMMLRDALHLVQQGRCFYCLKRIDEKTRSLDHVKPKSAGGQGIESFKNKVLACKDCNTKKGSQKIPEQWVTDRLQMFLTKIDDDVLDVESPFNRAGYGKKRKKRGTQTTTSQAGYPQQGTVELAA